MQFFAVQCQRGRRRKCQQQAEIDPRDQIAPAIDQIEIRRPEDPRSKEETEQIAPSMLSRREPQNQHQQQAVDRQLRKEAGQGFVKKEADALTGRGMGEALVPRLGDALHDRTGEGVGVKVVAVAQQLHVRLGETKGVIGVGHILIRRAAVVGIVHADRVKLVVDAPRLLRPGPLVDSVEAGGDEQHQHKRQCEPQHTPDFRAVLICENVPERAQGQRCRDGKAGQKLHHSQHEAEHREQNAGDEQGSPPTLPLRGGQQQGHAAHGADRGGFGVVDEAVDVHAEEQQQHRSDRETALHA